MSRTARRFTMRRVNTLTGQEFVKTGQSELDARQFVAYCAHDNLGQTQRDASRAADAAPVDGTQYPVGHYTFTITPE